MTNRDARFRRTDDWPSRYPRALPWVPRWAPRIRQRTPTGVTFLPTCWMATTHEFFNINKMNGQLTIGMKLNAERASGVGGDSYEVTITARDPSNVASEPVLTVTVTATDVNEAPEVTATGEMLKVPENHVLVLPALSPLNLEVADPLGTYDADDEDIGDGTGGTTIDSSQVKLSLEGDDEDQFQLSDPDTPGASQELTFKKFSQLRVANRRQPGQRLQGDRRCDRQEGPHGYEGSYHRSDEHRRGRRCEILVDTARRRTANNR